MNPIDLSDIPALLAPRSPGGIVEIAGTADLDALRATAEGEGARFAVLRAPGSKEELLAAIAQGLGLPGWFGRNWDALVEVLARPEPDCAGPILVVWLDPARLDHADPGASQVFHSIVASAGEQRLEQGLGPLVVARAQTEQVFDRLLLWRVDRTAGVDAAWVSVTSAGLGARGHISAQLPEPYSVRYSLETDRAYATRMLLAEVVTAHGTRQLKLAQEQGRWLVNGMPRRDLEDALDCDIAACPLTNTMPILRHELHRQPGEVTFSMAFVHLPELEVVRSEQTYKHLRRIDDDRALVRHSSGDFGSDLVIDEDGFVVEYPRLGAHRIAAQ